MGTWPDVQPSPSITMSPRMERQGEGLMGTSSDGQASPFMMMSPHLGRQGGDAVMDTGTSRLPGPFIWTCPHPEQTQGFYPPSATRKSYHSNSQEDSSVSPSLGRQGGLPGPFSWRSPHPERTQGFYPPLRTRNFYHSQEDGYVSPQHLAPPRDLSKESTTVSSVSEARLSSRLPNDLKTHLWNNYFRHQKFSIIGYKGKELNLTAGEIVLVHRRRCDDDPWRECGWRQAVVTGNTKKGKRDGPRVEVLSVNRLLDFRLGSGERMGLWKLKHRNIQTYNDDCIEDPWL